MAALSTMALLAVSAAQTAGKFADQRRAASAAERQGNYEGDLLEQNAGLADIQAQDTLARGREDEGRQRRSNRQLAGSQRAALAASGVDINSGSAQDVVDSDAALGEFDAMTIRNNAARQAWGYQVQAADYRRNAAMARAGGHETTRSLRNGSVTTLLTGAADLANLYSAAPKRISRGGSVPSGSGRPVDPRRTSGTPRRYD